MDKKNENEEVTFVTTTERFRLLKNIIKIFFAGCLLILTAYVIFITFGGYFFASLIVAFFLISITFSNIYQSQGEIVLECRIGSENDENEGDVIGIEKIPYEMYKEYKAKGSNIKKFTTKSGKSITIAEKIDHENKKITYPWFSILSDFEFFIKKETYISLKKRFKEIMNDILKTKETRDLYRQMETIKLLDYYEFEKDIDEIKSKLKGM